MANSGTLRAPFKRNDRVIVDYIPAGIAHKRPGTVVKMAFKEHPKHGKSPGWWATVRCDPPKGLKLVEIEIHADHLKTKPFTANAA